jgi:hypothetical protein
MHNLLISWIAAIYSSVLEEYGDEALYKINHKSCSFWLKTLLKQYSEAPLRRKVEMLASGLKGHLVPLRLDEDNEKFTITMLPCGSGGMLALQGEYKSQKLPLVQKAQPQTFSKENFPVYCTHCALQEIISIEMLGHPVFITDCPEGRAVGKEYCRIYIYKKPQNIPDEFYKRLGKEKRLDRGDHDSKE